MFLATFCNLANWLVSNLVINLKDRCSSDEARLLIDCKLKAVFFISVFKMTALLNLPIYSIFLWLLLSDLRASLMRIFK